MKYTKWVIKHGKTHILLPSDSELIYLCGREHNSKTHIRTRSRVGACGTCERVKRSIEEEENRGW